MAKVPLRAYNREIENMIEGGQLDEAIVHCQYILKAFPMYVETYRLLGKAFLEARRYADAADIFQRVLMAAPDDFVAHVGMSIILDNEGKLDDSVWHMERAFELQPSNPAIQGELRRLYGRRDGVEPAKIRLSRDALANMYAQGELFNQAIAEIRSVLADDPNRLDLQVMLARAYYRSGQKVEAAEVAAALLKKYPYCLDALRVLVDVLPDSTRSENIQAYRRRLRLLDPYSSFVADSVFASDQVADTAVSLDRFDYGAAAPSSQSQSEWASSLGFDARDEAASEPQPDQPEAEKFEKPPMPAEPSALPTQAAEGDLVPDWMRSAGWQESTGVVEESEAPVVEEPPAEPILKADIPDWLKAMAPPEVAGAEQVKPKSEPEPDVLPAEIPSSDTEATPDWLTGLGASRIDAAALGSAQAEEQPAQPEQLPTEEQTIRPEPAAQETGEPSASTVLAQGSTLPSSEASPVELPVSVNEEPLTASSPENEAVSSPFEETQASQPAPEGDAQLPAGQEDTLAWLARLAVEPEEPQDGSLAAPAPVETTPPETKAVSEEDVSLTSWLDKLEAAEVTEKFVPPSLNAEQPPAPVGDLPDWLKDLDKPLATPAPLPESPKSDGELDIPVWADENVPIAEEAAPTAHTEWLPAEKPVDETAKAVPPATTEIAAPIADVAAEAGVEAAQATTVPATPSDVLPGEVAAIPAHDQDVEVLSTAQAALDANTPGVAMKEYGKLIKKGHLLDEIIHDLQEAIYRFPVDVIVWQTLGDAYMRANRLQDALDAYTKAEELLR